MERNLKFFYIFIAVVVLAVSTIGATYAYWTASTASTSNAVYAKSTIYSISMDITPLYHGFSIIPMDDEDALKALKNGCKDKFGRGACSAYTIYVYDYNTDLGFISGLMDVTMSNMRNLSYMMLRLSDEFVEDSCVLIDEDSYCIGKEATPVGEGVGLSLGDSYSIVGTESYKFILLTWLSNLKQSQNEFDVGSFEATITMQAGNGGQIKGSISSVIVPVEPEDNSGVETEDKLVDSNNNNLDNVKNENGGTPE